MPRRSRGPRLYLDPTRQQWIIRDGRNFVRTGHTASQRDKAETSLAGYLDEKYKPSQSAAPSVAEVLLAYLKERAPATARPDNITNAIARLDLWWGEKTLADVTARNCRAYAEARPKVAGLRELEILRASINYWHKEYGPLAAVPVVTLPSKPMPRERWLTREEARRLRRAAMGTPHLYRFIVIALLTGSRPGVVLGLKWDWIDFQRGIMRRRGEGERETRKRRPPVRLGKALLRLLKRWKRMDGDLVPYVCHYNGQKVTKLRRSWTAAVGRAGLAGKVVPHTLRHTRATWLMQAGVDPWEAAGALGMTVQMIEQTYGHHSPEFQKKSAEV